MLSVAAGNQPPLASLEVEAETDGEVAAEEGEVMLLLPSEAVPIGGEGTSHIISYSVIDSPFILFRTRVVRCHNTSNLFIFTIE